MKLRIDLHVHTIYSRDSFIEVEELAPRCRAMDLDGLAVTDHENLEGGKRAAEICKNIIVIPGMEIETSDGHILALNMAKPVKKGLGLSEMIESTHELGGVAVIAHPFSLLRPLLDVDVIKASGLDAIETANATSFPYSLTTRMGTALAKRLNLPMTGGSDAHLPSVIGRSYTVVDSDSKDISDILEAVRKGRTEVRGEGVNLKERFLKAIRGARAYFSSASI